MEGGIEASVITTALIRGARPGPGDARSAHCASASKRDADRSGAPVRPGGWPATSAAWCWLCARGFGGPPIPFPTRCVAGVFHVTGTFCSWACMKAYGLHVYDERPDAGVVTLFRKRWTGETRGVRAAPHWKLTLRGDEDEDEDEQPHARPRPVPAPPHDMPMRVHAPIVCEASAARGSAAAAAAAATATTTAAAGEHRRGERTQNHGRLREEDARELCLRRPKPQQSHDTLMKTIGGAVR